MGKVGQEKGPKADRDKTERATGLGRRTRGDIYIEKWDQTHRAHAIPDRGETSEIPRPKHLEQGSRVWTARPHHRERERERERETDRETDRQTDTQRDRMTQRELERDRDRDTERETHTGRQRE